MSASDFNEPFYATLQKAVSSSGVQRDCVRLDRHINDYLTNNQLVNRYCREGANNYICTSDRCNTASTLTAAGSLVFISAAIFMMSSAYYALWRD